MTTNAEGLRLTLAALADSFEDGDAALVALATTLAEAVDADPCSNCKAGQNAALWKEYRATLATLQEVANRGDDDDTAAVRITFQTPMRAKVGDTS